MGVGSEAYSLYLKGFGGIFPLIGILLAFSLTVGATAFSSWWLKDWFQGGSSGSSRDIVGLNNDTESAEPNSTWTLDPSSDPFLISIKDSSSFPLYRNVYAGMILLIFTASLIRALFFVWVKPSQQIKKKST